MPTHDRASISMKFAGGELIISIEENFDLRREYLKGQEK
jgi:hypothetical protein